MYPIAAGMGFMTVVSLSLMFSPRGTAVTTVIAAVCVFGAPFLALRGLRLGVEIVADHVNVHGAYFTRRIPKVDIAGITTRRVFASTMVYLVLRNGRTVWLGLAQGVSVDSEGSRTKDIVGVLERELDLDDVAAARART